jgi:hypothetical protein
MSERLPEGAFPPWSLPFPGPGGPDRRGALTVLLDANDSQVDGLVSSITTRGPSAAK